MEGEAGAPPEAPEAVGPTETAGDGAAPEVAGEDTGDGAAGEYASEAAAAGEDAGEAGDAEAPDGVGEDVVGARVAARPTAGGPPKPGDGPRIERGRPPDGVAGGPPVAGGDGATGGTC